MERLQQLLGLLPLLRADNERGKAVYVAAVPALVQRCVDAPRASAPTPATDLCRQLLSYLLVHPALSQLEQRSHNIHSELTTVQFVWLHQRNKLSKTVMLTFQNADTVATLPGESHIGQQKYRVHLAAADRPVLVARHQYMGREQQL